MRKKEIKKVECVDCYKGIRMCKTRPCWGMVNDFEKIIKAGNAKKLMLEYYSNRDINKGENIYFLSGASNNNQCSKADWNPRGTCILLENDKCIIHDIKPTMGAVVCCKVPMDKKLMHECLMTWTTKAGLDLIKKWKEMVDYIDKVDDENFSMYDAIMLNF